VKRIDAARRDVGDPVVRALALRKGESCSGSCSRVCCAATSFTSNPTPSSYSNGYDMMILLLLNSSHLLLQPCMRMQWCRLHRSHSFALVQACVSTSRGRRSKRALHQLRKRYAMHEEEFSGRCVCVRLGAALLVRRFARARATVQSTAYSLQRCSAPTASRRALLPDLCTLPRLSARSLLCVDGARCETMFWQHKLLSAYQGVVSWSVW
jgi:hypothetical protein